MTEESGLNLEEIAGGILSAESVDVAVNKILTLDERFESFNLLKIYNYIMSNTNEPEIIMTAVKCADRFRDKSSLPYLTDILLLKNFKNTDSNLNEKFVPVRTMCAKAIANLKDPSGVSPLLYCLNNKEEHYRVRLACADALGKIGDRFAVTPLIEVMNDENEKSVYVKESAASALGLIGDMRAVDPLVSILEGSKGIVDKFTFLKERVIEALGKLKLDDNERVYRALKNSLIDESPQVRINAIEALMESDHPKAFDTIKPCLKDSDDEVKRNALIALYNLSDRDILDEVINSDDYSEFLKQEAKSIIEEYEDE